MYLCLRYNTIVHRTNFLFSKECQPFRLSNGVKKGNMNNVGSRKAYTCGTGYRVKTGRKSSICQPNGLWDYEPNCSQDQPITITNPTATPTTTESTPVTTTKITEITTDTTTNKLTSDTPTAELTTNTAIT